MKVKQLKNTGIESTNGYHIHKLGIFAQPGDKFRLSFKNNSKTSDITIGETSIYEIGFDIGIVAVVPISNASDFTIDILYSEED